MPLMKAWVDSANSADTDFPLNNLPYGVFSRPGEEARCGVAIGDQVLDMAAIEAAGLVTLADDPVFDLPFWNDVMDLGPEAWVTLRARLVELLQDGAPEKDAVAPHLVPLADVDLHMPFVVSEFTDFYAGRHHATNIGTMFRGADNALPPNWLHIPIGYNGRASSRSWSPAPTSAAPGVKPRHRITRHPASCPPPVGYRTGDGRHRRHLHRPWVSRDSGRGR